MQRTFIAIAFALALTSAFAAYTPNTANWVKAPLSVVADTDTNFTNQTGGGISMASVTIGDVYLLSQNLTMNTANVSASNWIIWLKKLDAKSLSAGANSTYTFTQTIVVTYYNNYAIGISVDNDTGIPQIRVYQQPLTGAALGRLTLSSNTNASWTPGIVGMASIKKVGYIFYQAANQKVNCTSFTIGGTVGSLEFTVTQAYTSGFDVTWGEALSTSQVFAIWRETDTLKDSVIDVSKGTVTPNTVSGFTTSITCSAYSTDKKWYGELCRSMNATTGISTYWIRTNTSSIVTFATYNTNTSSLAGFFPYGPYLALNFLDVVTSTPSQSYSYEIWNLDTLTTFKNRTQYLTIDTNSSMEFFRVEAGGLYMLLWNKRTAPNATLTNVQAGLLLGSSYLATVFGFLLTIIAGLLLF